MLGVLCSCTCFLFFFYLGFLSRISWFTGQQGKREDISLYPFYYFQPLLRYMALARLLTFSLTYNLFATMNHHKINDVISWCDSSHGSTMVVAGIHYCIMFPTNYLLKLFWVISVGKIINDKNLSKPAYPCRQTLIPYSTLVFTSNGFLLVPHLIELEVYASMNYLHLIHWNNKI